MPEIKQTRRKQKRNKYTGNEENNFSIVEIRRQQVVRTGRRHYRSVNRQKDRGNTRSSGNDYVSFHLCPSRVSLSRMTVRIKVLILRLRMIVRDDVHIVNTCT